MKNKILFIYPELSSFVKNDISILSSKFDVEQFHYIHKKNILHHIVFQFRLLAWFLLNFNNVFAVYIWFADYHSFIPVLLAKLMNKKSFIVLGGYDIVYLKELNYGSQNKLIRSLFTKYSVNNASMNLAVSDFIEETAKKDYPKANICTIYNGVRINSVDIEEYEKENLILTVGFIDSERRKILKGIDFFIKLSKEMSDYNFLLVGVSDKFMSNLGEIPQNLTIYKPLPESDLIEIYKKTKVYCQFSLIESFGLAIAEAMLYGAIPVVNNKGAMSEVVGDTGYLLEEQDISTAKRFINMALTARNSQRIRAQERIIEKYSLTGRKSKIYDIINC